MTTDPTTPSKAWMFDLTIESPRPSVFVQYKGTDLCGDFYCECGEQGHIDGDFVYYVKCHFCGAVYQMPPCIPMRKLAAGESPDGHEPHVFGKEDDDAN